MSGRIRADFVKDPDDELDYRQDWSCWLDDGDSIVDADALDLTGGLALYTGVVPGGVDFDATSVTVWLQGGSRIAASATVRISTAQGRTRDRTMHFAIKER